MGWDDGASGVSSILYKMKNGTFHIQHERQQDAGSGQHEFAVFAPSREVWHSLTVQHILGRLDGSVPAAGHPNGGKGRTAAGSTGRRNSTPETSTCCTATPPRGRCRRRWTCCTACTTSATETP